MDALTTAIGVTKGVSELARLIGVSQSAVSNWRARGGLVPVEHCTAIERATAGAVTRRDLRPDDWHRIWPELASCEAEVLPARQPAEVRNAA